MWVDYKNRKAELWIAINKDKKTSNIICKDVNNISNNFKAVFKKYQKWFLLYTKDWKILKVKWPDRYDWDWTSSLDKTFLNWKEVK